VLVRGGIDEKTGEALTTAAVAERVAWCAALVQGMAARLVAVHWNLGGLEPLASGRDAAGRPLPAMAWMALRRLGWDAVPPGGVKVNDRIIRMAQELAGRTLRSACWRDALTRAVVAAWPADPARRTPGEWGAVRAGVPGGGHLPSAVIRARTRQAARYLRDHGRLPADVTELEAPPRVPAMLILPACDRQQAIIERHGGDRDQGAWQRIAARGLTHQANTTTSRDTGTMGVRAVDDELEARAVVAPYASGRRDRSKSGPTPRRSTSRRAPRRHAAPFPPRSPRGGQRPEGHATPARQLPRAVARDQRASATCTLPARRPHQARGAALGAGFHLHAHATPPRREPDPQHRPANTG
jgi:hypothetical protein